MPNPVIVTANTSFFGQRGAKARFKHRVLEGYVPVFAQAAGSTAGRVTLIDGYAGPGIYQDGAPGSPLLLSALRQKIKEHEVRCEFVERKPSHAAMLRKTLADAGDTRSRVRTGDVAHEITDIVQSSKRDAVFAFLDPFGTALDYDLLTTVILRRTSARPTEVLLNLHLGTLRRIGARLSEPNHSAATKKALSRIDLFVGGDWWRPVYLDARDAGLSHTGAATRVADDYIRLVNHDAKCASFSVPVHERPGLEPEYVLVLFGRHPYGFWRFNDAVSLAQSDWLAVSASPQVSLFDPEPGVTQDELVAVIEANMIELLEEAGKFVPMRDTARIYGSVLGIARETHARSALKRLHGRGVTDDTGVGDFWEREITPKQ